MSDEAKKPFTARMAEIYRVPGSPAAAFMSEMKALTLEDRKWFADRLNKEGYPTEDPKG